MNLHFFLKEHQRSSRQLVKLLVQNLTARCPPYLNAPGFLGRVPLSEQLFLLSPNLQLLLLQPPALLGDGCSLLGQLLLLLLFKQLLGVALLLVLIKDLLLLLQLLLAGKILPLFVTVKYLEIFS